MSPVASREAGPKVYRGTGPAQGYVLVQWMGNTFHFVGMRPAAGTAGVGNERPSLQTWIAPQRDKCLAGAALRGHHGCLRLLPTFGHSHDGNGLCRKWLSQQSLD